MRPAIALLLVLGILLGPVYYAYCLLLSGRTTRAIEMTERASRWMTADGSILRFSNGLAYKPVSLELSPEMNRVTLRLNFTFEDSVDKEAAKEIRYQASLAQLDHTILERPISVQVKRSATRSVDVGPMEIPYPAEYLLLLVEVGEVRTVPRVELEVLEKVETPASSIVWSGMALLIVALIVTVRDALSAARSRHTH